MSDRGSLRAQSLTGLRWLAMGQAAGVLMQVAYTAISARLLSPAEFGIVATAQIALRFVSYFADGGLASAIIQAPSISKVQLRQLNAVLILTALAFGGCLALAAPVIGDLVNNTTVGDVTAVMATGFLVSATGVVPFAWLRREMRFRTVALIEATSYGVGYLLVAITCALAGLGVWSLVFGSLAAAAVKSLASMATAGVTLGLSRPTREVLPVVRFGGRVSSIGFMEFWASNLDVAALSRFGGAAATGQYTKATSLVALPLHHLGLIFSRVLLTTFARSDRRTSGRVLSSSLVVLAAVIAPFLIGAGVFADDLVGAALGSQWGEAADLMPWIAAAVAVNTLTLLPGVALEGQGVLRPKAVLQAAHLTTAALLMTYCVWAGLDAWAYAAAWLAGELVRHAWYLVILSRSFGVHAGEILWGYAAALMPCVAGIAVGRLVHGSLDGQLAMRLAGEGLALLVTWMLCTAAWASSPMRRGGRAIGLAQSLPGRRFHTVYTRLVG